MTAREATRALVEREWRRLGRRALALLRSNPGSPEVDEVFARMDAIAGRRGPRRALVKGGAVRSEARK